MKFNYGEPGSDSIGATPKDSVRRFTGFWQFFPRHSEDGRSSSTAAGPGSVSAAGAADWSRGGAAAHGDKGWLHLASDGTRCEPRSRPPDALASSDIPEESSGPLLAAPLGHSTRNPCRREDRHPQRLPPALTRHGRENRHAIGPRSGAHCAV